MAVEEIVGNIYDCAANPELWPATLGKIRDMADLAYVMIGHMDLSHADASQRYTNLRHSDWDPKWVQRLLPEIPSIPHLDLLFRQGIDVPWIQMEHLPEAEFQESAFYRNWVKPQKLRDAVNTLFIDRKVVHGVMVMTRYENKPLLGDEERRLAMFLSPHIRRAIAINDIVDKGNLALSLYRKVLDTLSVAVFVAGNHGKLEFANAQADALLSSGDLLRLVGGKLAAIRTEIAGTKFADAIARGIQGDKATGISGIGVPLLGKSGERAAAYVLPLSGSEFRSQMGPGHVAIFIARRGEQQPMAIEILRTVYDFTPMEARMAYAASLGDTLETIAATMGNSLETVRTHMKGAYRKAGVSGKASLTARIHELIPPVDTTHGSQQS
jgi:DNA-binding CsgD family transcriptional regulator